jgi:hypothetical protein
VATEPPRGERDHSVVRGALAVGGQPRKQWQYDVNGVAPGAGKTRAPSPDYAKSPKTVIDTSSHKPKLAEVNRHESNAALERAASKNSCQFHFIKERSL